MSELKKGVYKHYKGAIYEVLGEGKHSETNEECVIYRPIILSKLEDKTLLWVRPKKMFLEDVIINVELSNGTKIEKKIPRFQFIYGT